MDTRSRPTYRAAPREAFCRQASPTCVSTSASWSRTAASSAPGAVVVLSDRDDIRSVARNLMAFFEDESCGQCTPCRVGCEKMLHLIAQPRWDGALIKELSEAMRDASICGLGQAAPNPVLTALRYFEGELR